MEPIVKTKLKILLIHLKIATVPALMIFPHRSPFSRPVASTKRAMALAVKASWRCSQARCKLCRARGRSVDASRETPSWWWKAGQSLGFLGSGGGVEKGKSINGRCSVAILPQVSTSQSFTKNKTFVSGNTSSKLQRRCLCQFTGDLLKKSWSTTECLEIKDDLKRTIISEQFKDPLESCTWKFLDVRSGVEWPWHE